VIAQSNGQRDWTLVLLMAFAGLMSALITMCTSYSLGHYAVSRGRLLDFSQMFFPGAVFGAIISGCFVLCGYLRDLWKPLVISVVSSVSYAASVWAAFAVELYSPFLNNQERGWVSGQALFVGGLVGALSTLSAISLLLNSEFTWQRRIFNALCWTPAGGLLGIAGWALGPSLGMAFWQIVHSMNLTAPTETFRNAQGLTSHTYSLLAVWQAGMGFALGLVVNGKSSTTDER